MEGTSATRSDRRTAAPAVADDEGCMVSALSLTDSDDVDLLMDAAAAAASEVDHVSSESPARSPVVDLSAETARAQEELDEANFNAAAQARPVEDSSDLKVQISDTRFGELKEETVYGESEFCGVQG